MYVVFFFFKTEPKIIEAINLRHDFKKKKSNLHETERIARKAAQMTIEMIECYHLR